jgi:hypothetical protein
MVDLAPDRHHEDARTAGSTGAGNPDAARWLRTAGILISVVGALVLLGAGVRLGGGIQSLSPFVAWGLFPFGVGLFGLRSRRVGVPRSVSVTLASGFGLAVYADLLWSSHLSSTAGLTFLFVPIWQTLGCGVALLLTMRWRGRNESA